MILNLYWLLAIGFGYPLSRLMWRFVVCTVWWEVNNYDLLNTINYRACLIRWILSLVQLISWWVRRLNRIEGLASLSARSHHQPDFKGCQELGFLKGNAHVDVASLEIVFKILPNYGTKLKVGWASIALMPQTWFGCTFQFSSAMLLVVPGCLSPKRWLPT